MQAPVGQVIVPELGEIFIGEVAHLAADRMTLRHRTPLSSVPTWRPGTPAGALFLLQGNVFKADASIETITKTELDLKIHTVHKKVNERGSPRRACNVEASYRVIRSDRSLGLFRPGRIIDISMGGLGFRSPAANDISDALDLVFYLPDETNADGSAMGPLGDNESLELSEQQSSRIEAAHRQNKLQPIRTRVRVVHRRMFPDGALRLGLSFVSIAPYSLLRVCSFVEEVERISQLR